MGSCTGLLLGRRTFEMFAPAWSARTADEDPGAPFMNESPKYVVAGTQLAVEWDNTHVLGPYDAGAIRDLKERVDGDLYVSGSGQLVRGMLADGLVDELHLFVYPVALGGGERLFAEPGEKTAFKLARQRGVRERCGAPLLYPLTRIYVVRHTGADERSHSASGVGRAASGSDP